MLKLTVDNIRDFQVCAYYYSLEKEKHPHPINQKELLASRYNSTLRKVMSFFFYKRQAGITPSYNALVNRWEKLWFPKDMDAYDLAVEQHHHRLNLATYSNSAINALLSFYKDFAEDNGTPIIIDEEFLTTFMYPDLRLAGKFDLVLQYKNRLKVVQWLINPKIASGQTIMDFAAIKHAFENRRVGKVPVPIEYYLYDVSLLKGGFKQMKPGPEDMASLRYWTNEIRLSEQFIPRRGCTIYCKGCKYDVPCREFTFDRLIAEEI